MITIILKRVFILYLIAAAVVCLLGTPQQAWRHAVPNTLSRYIPDYDDLMRFKTEHKALSSQKWEEFERYFKKVGDLMPSLPDAPAMQGFCLYQLGRYSSAKAAYQSAIQRYPLACHFYYNLGVIALKLQDTNLAIDSFQKTLALDPKRDIEFIIGSHIYTPLLPYPGNDMENARALTMQVAERNQKACQHILKIYWSLKDYSSLLVFADFCIRQRIDQPGVYYFYAGWAAYHMKEYAKAVYYLQEAIKLKFQYAEAYEALGASLQALHRPESQAALMAFARLANIKKFYFSIPVDYALLMF